MRTHDKILANLKLLATPEQIITMKFHIALSELIHSIAAEIDTARIKSPNYGRPCLVTQRNRATQLSIQRPAKFHFWGMRYDRDTKQSHTVGVFEYEDGQVGMKYPDQIQFTDSKAN